jgi:basic membrane protein A and related proteins
VGKEWGRSVLATLLFTDIVGSTKVAEEMGDRRWRELLARHHRILRQALREFDGHELDTAGDGVFARFNSPASAIRCAWSASDAVRQLGIQIRAGIHIGECEVLDGKLSGLNVHVAARTMAKAGPSQVLVTGSVRGLVGGAGFGFTNRGIHELKGIEGERDLFEVTSVDDAPRPAPASEEEYKSRRDSIVPPPFVKRRGARLTAMAAALAVLIAGATIALAHSVGRVRSGPITGCEVAPVPPLNDHAFNQAVFDGLTDAATTWRTSVRDAVSKAFDPDEWAKHIREFVNEKCNLIVTIGPYMAVPTIAAARTHPEQRFLVTDFDVGRGLRNVLSVVFRIDQAAFQAGYLAAGMTHTGKVATFGGIPVPTITPFMNGFAAGILYFNQLNGTKVQLLGWDPKNQKGTFVSQDPSDVGAFGNDVAALRISADLISAGADILMPVDGPAGEDGAGRAARRAHGVLLIGVDTDQHFSTPDYGALWLTSVLKVYRRMVYLGMGQVVNNDFKGGVLFGTLANGGVGLAPFYGLGDRVPASLLTKLDEIKAGIADGSISVSPASYLGA